MWQRLALLGVAALLVPGIAGGERRIMGGSAIDVRQAPWVVFVTTSVGDGSSGVYCTGTIIDATHVVTAGHCLDLGPQWRASLETVTVRAGASRGVVPGVSDVVQDRVAASYRVHPGFKWRMAGAPDDVA